MSNVNTGSPLGYEYPDHRIRAISRVSCTRGDVMLLDEALSDGDVTGLGSGTNGSTGNVIAPTAGSIAQGTFVVAEETLAADEEGTFLIEGYCDFVTVDGGTTDIAAGDGLIPTTGRKLAVGNDAGTAIATGKILAIATAAETTNSGTQPLYFVGKGRGFAALDTDT
jgi:hypothetical protein